MSMWRAWLAAAGLSLIVTASLTAFVTLSVPAMRDRPQVGLVFSAAVFLGSLAGVVWLMRRRK